MSTVLAAVEIAPRGTTVAMGFLFFFPGFNLLVRLLAFDTYFAGIYSILPLTVLFAVVNVNFNAENHVVQSNNCFFCPFL